MWMYAGTGAVVLALVVRRVMARTPKEEVEELREERMPREEVLV
jgi:hypothetical protein